ARVVATGGSSGSGWLLGPSLIQTYCSLPNVTNETGPENEASRLSELANTKRRACGLFSSRLTNITDQLPSGRSSAYDVTSRSPSSSFMSLAEENMRCNPERCCAHSRLIMWAE